MRRMEFDTSCLGGWREKHNNTREREGKETDITNGETKEWKEN